MLRRSSVNHLKLLQQQKTQRGKQMYPDPMESSIPNETLAMQTGGETCAEGRKELGETLSQQRWTAPAVHGVTWNKPLRNSYIEPLSWVWIQTALRLLIQVTLAKGSHGNSPFSWRNTLNPVWTAHHSPSSNSGSITFLDRFLNPLMLPVHWEMNLILATTETYIIIISTSLSF